LLYYWTCHLSHTQEKTQMIQELGQFTFSGDSEETHTKYGLAAWAD